MARLNELISRFESFDVERAAVEALKETEDNYDVLLKEQLMSGKGSDGQDLSPGYLEDPYFKTREAAQKYLNWKQKITPNPNRNPNAPNLFIRGDYHRSIRVTASTTGITIDSNSPIAADVDRKYNKEQSKLGGDFRQEYVFGRFWGALKHIAARNLKLSFQ